MVDGIESIGGFGGGHGHPGGGRGTSPPPAPPPPAPASAAQAQEPAVFAPIADLLDDIARLAESDPDARHEDAQAVAARMLGEAEAAREVQARLDASCVRALLGPAR